MIVRINKYQADAMAAVKGIAALEGNWWYGGTLSPRARRRLTAGLRYGLLL